MAETLGPGAVRDEVAYGTVLDHFLESEELMSLVTALPEVCEELRNRERSEERFTSECHGLILIITLM